ncbi:DUF5106 domain-containing protein [Fulvivirga sp. RKSG066]|uniref:DUF5106 domain-containing protein n=1 Tax=Fulvivirga aurantia TaxID=2529383 RepID=UPI0012BBC819|nr:thioredoxin-like domain-containing protein [Fulvivirga aurantia]MTI21183.1 DUF5106 domain-containing protein [Fulvivirga aurantia]
MTLYKYVVAISLFIISFTSHGQTGYDLKFEISGLADTTVLLGNFFGESTYVKDTAMANANGEFSFQGNETLEKGIYFLVLGKTRLFDFPIGDDQHFTLKANKPDYVLNMQVSGDKDNKLYFNDLKYNAERNKEAQPFIEIIRDSTSAPDELAGAREALDALNTKVMAHQQELIDAHPDAIISKIHKANKRIEVPEAPEGTDEQTYKYNYYKSHYWDYFDLSDPVMLRLANPVYQEKYNNYLDKLVLQQPDSLIKEIDALVAQAKTNQDTYKYAVWTAVIKYQYPEIMGLDKVYVHLFDKYFASGEMDYWANNQLKNNLRDRADQLRNSLVGNKAPNLIMQDQNLQRRVLYDIPNAYTVIYFFDPDCGHCKKETPKLVKFYNETDFDVEVFAVSADTSLVKMKDYIKDMDMNWVTVNGPRTFTQPYQTLYDATTTPTIYVLDRDKKIIAKKLPAERLEEFLTRYEAIEEKNKP